MTPLKPYFGAQALLTHESSHDTLDETRHVNWLVNGAGQGVYAHGRVHQEVGNTIFVGDLIHKRGHLSTDDLLLMEEQALLSCGEPLSVNSRLGDLTTMAMLPAMATANGEGTLVAYYTGGVVSFDTHEVPRETRHDGEGNIVQKGWDTKRLINHLLNAVSAVGRYAVTVLTRDHLFRSRRGLHFLKVTMGQETFKSENVNMISMDVATVLDADPPELLHGTATGFWMMGDRMFATTGLVSNPVISASPAGRGFVSWNQANTYTDDLTPHSVWEGVWVMDDGMFGIHRFMESAGLPTKNSYGFICSSTTGGVFFATIDHDLDTDIRDGVEVPIEWSFETACFAPGKLHNKASINDCVIELVCRSSSQRARVLVRTDATGSWQLWRNLTLPNTATLPGQSLLFTESLGKPPEKCREVSWIQLRVEGIGPAEIRLIDLDFSESTAKAGRHQSYLVSTVDRDHFETNNSPPATRWQSA
jgi:hypothetical protein